ncbi:S-layer protein, partial [Candidatus Micrarchaeota archaeon]|nr:S-layer protein [Candidatus Micrarchaeota archaeon]
MRNFNIKKLAAVAAGAVLVGTALAPIVAADMPTKSDLVASDGSMNVDIVVGSKAKASDVVWAGNIAAVLAQKAYVEKDVMTGGGECIGATPSIEGLKATVTVGGTVTVSGGKVFYNDMYSTPVGGSAQQEANFNSQMVTNSNIPSLKYFSSKSYLYNGTSYTTTMQERLVFTADVMFDYQGENEMITEFGAGGLRFNLNLGSGVPRYESLSSTLKFSDDANDNVRIPWFGELYLVKQVDSANNYLELIKGSAEKSYSEGDKLTGLVGKNGENFYIVVGPGGTVGTASTQKVTMTLYSEDGTQIVSDDFGAEDVTFYWPDDYADAGEVILQTLVTITEIKKTVLADAEIYYPTILTGTDRLEFYNDKGYPYDSTKTSEEYDWESKLFFDGNYLKDVNIQNTSQNRYTSSKALRPGDEAAFPSDWGTVKFLGLQLPEFSTNGISKTERTTTIELKDEALYYRDNTYEADHVVPFYVGPGGVGDLRGYDDDSTGTFTIDGKTIWFKIDTTDKNILASTSATGTSITAPGSNQCIGDGNYINGEPVKLETFTDATSVVVNGTAVNQGARADINGMQFLVSKVDNTNSCAHFAADGNIAFRKDTSTGELIQEAWFVDENAANDNSGNEAPISFEGASGLTHDYILMVNRSGTSGQDADIYLLLDDQVLTTQYNKKVGLVGVDAGEDAFNAGSGDADFYVPHNSYLPAEWQSDGSNFNVAGTTYSLNNYVIAKFKIDEDESTVSATAEANWDFNVFIDTSTGQVPVLANSNLDIYTWEADWNQGGKLLTESTTNPTAPSVAYSDFGTKMSLVDHKYKAV